MTRVSVRGEEYGSGPPCSSVTMTTTVVTAVSRTVPAKSTGLPSSGANGAFYERGEREQHEKTRTREGERTEGEENASICGRVWNWGYHRDEHRRRGPPLMSSRGLVRGRDRG